jgi:hypothetical protein
MPQPLAANISHSLAADLFTLVAHPRSAFPDLLQRRRPMEIMAFSAISGVYVAYLAAERLHLGDSVGFGPALVFVLVCGPGLGLLALAFTDVVLTATASAAGTPADREVLAGVFGYATAPFLPLLVLLATIETTAYGSALFSAHRPYVSPVIPAITTALEILAIGAWLALMVEGTAAAVHVSEGRAARAVGLTFVRMLMILVLLALISIVSFMI